MCIFLTHLRYLCIHTLCARQTPPTVLQLRPRPHTHTGGRCLWQGKTEQYRCVCVADCCRCWLKNRAAASSVTFCVTFKVSVRVSTWTRHSSNPEPQNSALKADIFFFFYRNKSWKIGQNVQEEDLEDQRVVPNHVH